MFKDIKSYQGDGDASTATATARRGSKARKAARLSRKDQGGGRSSRHRLHEGLLTHRNGIGMTQKTIRGGHPLTTAAVSTRCTSFRT